MPYSIYIAAPTTQQQSANALAEQLIANTEHRITSSWHTTPILCDEITLSPESRNKIAETCLEEIDSCSIMILFAIPGQGKGGCFTEFGYAIASGIPVIVIHFGDLSVFTELAGVYCLDPIGENGVIDTFEVIRVLKDLEEYEEKNKTERIDVRWN